MRIAACSDEPYPVHATIVAELERRGHQVVRFGSLASGREEPWAVAGRSRGATSRVSQQVLRNGGGEVPPLE
ncbi:MAG: hypothetical protein JRI25_15580 [Deltaproteobacteria bacterium]|nr:hypothetical protein [Deltaproteobacteria bacterium]MBW2256004.1 hypothetical protein [Deltaproteobacteria bacterium]